MGCGIPFAEYPIRKRDVEEREMNALWKGLIAIALAGITPASLATSGLRIDSEPRGAEITLNGKKIGKTPLACKFSPGVALVRVGDCTVKAEVKKDGVAEIVFQQVGDTSWKATPPSMVKAHLPFIEYAQNRGGAFSPRLDPKSRIPKAWEESIDLALLWLAAHQDPSGRWSAKAYHLHCRGSTCTGSGATSMYDIGVTGLSLLAYLGAGHSMTNGSYENTVRRGMEYLLRFQRDDGLFKEGKNHSMYCQILATLAVLECGEMDGSETLRSAGRKAIGFLLKAQNPGEGWRYGVRPRENDTSLTCWALHALILGKALGTGVPFDAVRGGLTWIDRMTGGEWPYYRVGYLTPGDSGARLAEAVEKYEPTEAMTAAALHIQLMLGRSLDVPFVYRATHRILECPPKWDATRKRLDMYYWFFGTHALSHAGADRKAPKAFRTAWQTWRSALEKALLPHQCTGKAVPHARGSWEPVGAWGMAGGRVYATAICALTLEAPNRTLCLRDTLGLERTFLPQFRERILRGELGYSDLDRYAEKAKDRKSFPAEGRSAFRVLYLDPYPKKDKWGREHYLLGHFFLEFPTKRLLFVVPEKIDEKTYIRMKKMKVGGLVDLGPFSGYATKDEGALLYENKITKSRSSMKYRGKLPVNGRR
jgi:hypothetical protein